MIGWIQVNPSCLNRSKVQKCRKAMNISEVVHKQRKTTQTELA